MPGAAFGATYYVNGSCGENGDGSAATCAAGSGQTGAHDTFSNLLADQALVGNDVVYVADGTYPERVIITTADDGTAGNLVTFREIDDAVIIDGVGEVDALLLNGADYIRFEGFEFKGGTRETIYCTAGNDGVEFYQCTFTNNGDGAENLVTFFDGSGNLFDTCTFNQNANTLDGIELDQTDDVGDESNIIRDCDFVGDGSTSANGSVLDIDDSDNITISNVTITDWAVSSNVVVSITSSDGVNFDGSLTNTQNGVLLNGCNDVAIGETTLTNMAGNQAIYFSSCTGTNTINSITITDAAAGLLIDDTNLTGTNIYATGSTGAQIEIVGTSVVTLNTVTSNNSAYSGIRTDDTAVLTVNNGVFDGNADDGVTANGSGSLTCNKCLSINNGIDDVSSGDGYTVHETATLNINNSMAYGNTKSGVAGATSAACNGNILNNSFYGNDDYGIKIGCTGTWTVKNNIVQSHTTEYIVDDAAVTLTSDYNLFDGGTAEYNYDGTDYNSLALFAAASSTDSHSIEDDPLFVNPAAGDLRLKAASPAIDAGTDVGLTTDYFGNIIYGTPDIGAIEYLIGVFTGSGTGVITGSGTGTITP